MWWIPQSLMSGALGSVTAATTFQCVVLPSGAVPALPVRHPESMVSLSASPCLTFLEVQSRQSPWPWGSPWGSATALKTLCVWTVWSPPAVYPVPGVKCPEKWRGGKYLLFLWGPRTESDPCPVNMNHLNRHITTPFCVANLNLLLLFLHIISRFSNLLKEFKYLCIWLD